MVSRTARIATQAIALVVLLDSYCAVRAFVQAELSSRGCAALEGHAPELHRSLVARVRRFREEYIRDSEYSETYLVLFHDEDWPGWTRPVGFAKAARTTALGYPKELRDSVPFVATWREGLAWAGMFASAAAYDAGTSTKEQKETLEYFQNWRGRDRGMAERAGAIFGDLPVAALELMGVLVAGLGAMRLLETTAWRKS